MQGNGAPKTFGMEVLKDEGNSKGLNLSYAWGKVTKLYALTLFDPNSTHNFILHELALKLGIHEMGDVIQAKGAFKGERGLSCSPHRENLIFIFNATWIKRIFIYPHSNLKM